MDVSHSRADHHAARYTATSARVGMKRALGLVDTRVIVAPIGRCGRLYTAWNAFSNSMGR